MKGIFVAATFFVAVLSCACTFGTVTIDMVPVGNPGNDPDTEVMTCCNSLPKTSGFGAVGYGYQIGKYEITAAQFTEFLNAVAKTDPYNLYDGTMGVGDFLHPGPHILKSGTIPNYSYSVAADWANRPMNYVTFWDAVRFANWLHNGQPTGEQGPGTTEDGAYHNVGSDTLFGRNPNAKFFIPTENEWYKAAYYDGTSGTYYDYPTGTNTLPGNDINETINPGNNANYRTSTGYTPGVSVYFRSKVGEFELSKSPYGTFDQGGNVYELTETAAGSKRIMRGGSYNGGTGDMRANTHIDWSPTERHAEVGFRVAAATPEPSTCLLSAFTALALLGYLGRNRRALV